MAKIKDFILSISKKGGITNADLETVLAASALNEIELPAEFVEAFDQKFLTRERAINDPQIVTELTKASNRTAFATFDEKINGFLGLVDPEDADKIKNTRETYEKYDLLKAALKKGGSKKVNDDANKILEEWTTKYNTLKDQSEKEKAAIKEESKKFMTDYVLKSKILAHNFADAFTPLRESISDITVNKIRSSYTPVLNEKGELRLMTPTEGGSLVDAYDGNELLTVDKLLAKELKAFISVSKKPEDNEKKPIIPNGVDMSKMTLQELRQYQAAVGM